MQKKIRLQLSLIALLSLATPSLFAADTQSQGLFAQVEVSTVADVKRYIGQAVAIQYGWTQSCGKLSISKEN
jgi:hypothetical protein